MALPYCVKELQFENPTFTSIPVSYLITMVDSNRKEAFLRQLFEFRPTRKVVVVFNRGFKRCFKPGVTTPAQDIWHANQFVAAHSGGAEFVLVLEDDVEFTPRFRVNAPRIERFLSSFKGKPVMYSLGAQAFLSYCSHADHVRVLAGGFAHAVIYSRPALNRFRGIQIPRWGLHDMYLYSFLESYACKSACAVQKFERTDNSQNWDALRLNELVNHACGGDAVQTYDLYHLFNSVGGIVAVLVYLMVVAALVRAA